MIKMVISVGMERNGYNQAFLTCSINIDCALFKKL